MQTGLGFTLQWFTQVLNFISQLMNDPLVFYEFSGGCWTQIDGCNRFKVRGRIHWFVLTIRNICSHYIGYNLLTASRSWINYAWRLCMIRTLFGLRVLFIFIQSCRISCSHLRVIIDSAHSFSYSYYSVRHASNGDDAHASATVSVISWSWNSNRVEPSLICSSLTRYNQLPPYDDNARTLCDDAKAFRIRIDLQTSASRTTEEGVISDRP